MEEELWPTVVAWTIYLGATTVAAVAGSLWWRKEKKGARKSARKPASSPGIRVAEIQDASGGSNTARGWRSLIGGSASSSQGRTSKWEQSKKKGDLGYYFAHHTSLKELAPEDYQMNGPRLLRKGGAPAAPANGTTDTDVRSSSPPPPVAPRRRAQQITSYSWEDYGEEVRLTFRQSGWEWGKVEEEEIGIEWGTRRFRMSIDSREYGTHAIDLQNLAGEVGDVRVLKMKNRLSVTLVKGGRGSHSKRAPWDKLQAPPEKRPDEDTK